MGTGAEVDTKSCCGAFSNDCAWGKAPRPLSWLMGRSTEPK